MTPLQHRTVTVLTAMQTVGIPDDEQVDVLISCLAALCCGRARNPAQSHQMAMVCENDLHQRIDDAWAQADPILKAMQAKHK